MNKKIILLVSAVLLVVLLVGALVFGVDWDHTVGICYKSDTDASNIQFRTALEKALMDRGVQVITLSAQADPEKQLEQIQQLAERDCDVLLVEPVSVTAPKELTDMLKTLGLPAVVTGVQAERLTDNRLITYLGLDPAKAGTVQAQMARGLPDGGDINGDGTVSYVILQGPDGHIDAQLRIGALGFALQGHELAVKQGQWTRESGQQMCMEALSDYGIDIEVIFCGNDQITQGAAAAVAESGWTAGTDLYLFGMGTQSETLELMTSGGLNGTVAFDEAALARYVEELLYSKLMGEALPQQPELTYMPVLP